MTMNPNIWPRVFTCDVCGEVGNGFCARLSCIRSRYDREQEREAEERRVELAMRFIHENRPYVHTVYKQTIRA